MKYGKELKNARRLGWENAYIDYDKLKSLLKSIENAWQASRDLADSEGAAGGADGDDDDDDEVDLEGVAYLDDDEGGGGGGNYMIERLSSREGGSIGGWIGSFLGAPHQFSHISSRSNSFPATSNNPSSNAAASADTAVPPNSFVPIGQHSRSPSPLSVFGNLLVDGLAGHQSSKNQPSQLASESQRRTSLQVQQQSKMNLINRLNAAIYPTSLPSRRRPSAVSSSSSSLRGGSGGVSRRRQALDSLILSLASRFFGLLQSEIEKVSLFALSKVGDLSDTVGALRFGDGRLGKPQPERRRREGEYEGGGGGDDDSDDGDDDDDDDDGGSATTTDDCEGANERRTTADTDEGANSSGEEEDSMREGQRRGGRGASTPGEEQDGALPASTTRRAKKDSPSYTGDKKDSRYNTHHHHHHLQPASSTSTYYDTSKTMANSFDQDNKTRPMFSDRILGEDQAFLLNAVDEADAYTQVGVEVLHLLRYICVNAMATRKILKKHDKLMSKNVLSASTSKRDKSLREFHRLAGGADAHMRVMCNSTGISAVTASLISALSEFQTAHNRAEEIRARAAIPPSAAGGYHSLRGVTQHAQSLDSSPSSPSLGGGGGAPLTSSANFFVEASAPITRLQHTISSIQTVRLATETTYNTFEDFLSRRAFMVTGSNLGDLGGSSVNALSFLLAYDPSTAPLHGADVYWSPNRDRLPSEIQDYDQLTAIPLVLARNQEHVNRILNLTSVFLYTTNYYIISPTAGSLAELCGSDSSFAGALIGTASSAAFVGAFVYSVWSTKGTFKSALLFSAMAPIVGNFLYGYSITPRSINIAYVGRLLVGLGSCEVCNRSFITQTVPPREMTGACARFVAASAIGMSAGPLIAGFLDTFAGRTIADPTGATNLPFGLIFNHVTSPGFIMSGLWIVQFLCLFFFFKEPLYRHRQTENESSHKSTGYGGHGSPGSAKSAKHGKSKKESADSDEGDAFLDVYAADESESLVDGTKLRGAHGKAAYGAAVVRGGKTTSSASKSTRVKASKTFVSLLPTNVQEAWGKLEDCRVLIFSNMAFPITLMLFGFIELADEVLINSVALITRRYFNWHGAFAGFLVAGFGLFVLPANYVMEVLCRKYDERQLMKIMLYVCFIGTLFMMNFVALFGKFDFESIVVNAGDVDNPYDPSHKLTKTKHSYDGVFGQYQYLVGIVWVFTGTIMLEGVVTSIMAKSAPAKLEATFLNAGLQATLIGTLGRVAADAFIVVAGLAHELEGYDFVNAVLVQLGIVFAIGIYVTRKNYKSILV